MLVASISQVFIASLLSLVAMCDMSLFVIRHASFRWFVLWLTELIKLPSELSKLKNTFLDNGYPAYLINKVISSYDAAKVKPEGPKRHRLFIKLPFLGKPSYRFERMIKLSVDQCFPSVSTNVIFESTPMLPNMLKDRLPTLSSQKIIYLFSCQCNGRYVGKTDR